MRDTVTPASSSGISSLRRLLVPPRLVCAVSARTRTPRATAAVERVGDLDAIEPEDQDVDALLRLLDGGDDRRDAGVRLDDQFHKRVTQTAATIQGTGLVTFLVLHMTRRYSKLRRHLMPSGLDLLRPASPCAQDRRQSAGARCMSGVQRSRERPTSRCRRSSSGAAAAEADRVDPERDRRRHATSLADADPTPPAPTPSRATSSAPPADRFRASIQQDSKERSSRDDVRRDEGGAQAHAAGV